MTIINCPVTFYNKYEKIGKSKTHAIPTVSNETEEKNKENENNKLQIFIEAQKKKLNILNIDLTPTQQEIQKKKQ